MPMAIAVLSASMVRAFAVFRNHYLFVVAIIAVLVWEFRKWLVPTLVLTSPCVFALTACVSSVPKNRNATIQRDTRTLLLETERLLPLLSGEDTLPVHELASVQVTWNYDEYGVCMHMLDAIGRDGRKYRVTSFESNERDLLLAEALADHLAAALDAARLPSEQSYGIWNVWR